MPWTLTGNVHEFLGAAGEFLRSQAAQNTVLLGVTESVRVRGPAVFGDAAPLFGWWHDDGAPSAAFLHTPPRAVVLTAMPGEVAAALAGELAVRGRPLTGVNGDTHAGPAFAAAWRARTGQASYAGMRSRLYRLGELWMPVPAPPGSARAATEADRDLLVAWLDAFHREALSREPVDVVARIADDRLSYGGLWLWETDGRPVSMAGLTRAVAGQVRVGLVYTPPHLRRRGFGAAVTAAVSKAALEEGVGEVLLFTDLANPTSNAIYQRLGYRPAGDRVVLGFGPPGAPQGAGHG